MDDPNEEFVFYLEAIQCKLEGNKTYSRVLEAAEPVKPSPVQTSQVDKVTTTNICAIVVGFLYDLAKNKSTEGVLAATLQDIKEFDIYKKKDFEDFKKQFQACLGILEKNGILIPTDQTDVFHFNHTKLDKLGNELYQALKNEDEMEFNFQFIYDKCNQLVSATSQQLLSKELVYRIVNELFKMNKLYKADKNLERYGVS